MRRATADNTFKSNAKFTHTTLMLIDRVAMVISLLSVFDILKTLILLSKGKSCPVNDQGSH